MHVGNSGDVSLEGASFSECTAARVRLPRSHTRLPRTRTLARHRRAGSGRRRQRHGVAKGGTHSPKGH